MTRLFLSVLIALLSLGAGANAAAKEGEIPASRYSPMGKSFDTMVFVGLPGGPESSCRYDPRPRAGLVAARISVILAGPDRDVLPISKNLKELHAYLPEMFTRYCGYHKSGLPVVMEEIKYEVYVSFDEDADDKRAFVDSQGARRSERQVARGEWRWVVPKPGTLATEYYLLREHLVPEGLAKKVQAYPEIARKAYRAEFPDYYIRTALEEARADFLAQKAAFYDFCATTPRNGKTIRVDGGARVPQLSPARMCSLQTQIADFLRKRSQCAEDPRCDANSPETRVMVRDFVTPALAILNTNVRNELRKLPGGTEARAHQLGRIYHTFIANPDAKAIYNSGVMITNRDIADPGKWKNREAYVEIGKAALSHQVTLADDYVLARVPNARKRMKKLIKNHEALDPADLENPAVVLQPGYFSPERHEWIIQRSMRLRNYQGEPLKDGIYGLYTSYSLANDLRRRNNKFASEQRERKFREWSNQAIMPLAFIAGVSLLGLAMGGEVPPDNAGSILEQSEWGADKPISTFGYTPNDFLLRDPIPSGF